MWWDSLASFQQYMFIIAISSTIVMVIFMILMIIGIDDADFDGGDGFEDFSGLNDEPLSGIAGLRIFTIRGVLVFLSIGAWTSYLFYGVVINWLAIIFGVVAGTFAAYLQALAFRSMMKLESSGNMNYELAVGKTGTVYIRIPKQRMGKGKINLVLQERFIEVDAVTLESEDLLTKTAVEVVGLENATTLIVKRKV